MNAKFKTVSSSGIVFRIGVYLLLAALLIGALGGYYGGYTYSYILNEELPGGGLWYQFKSVFFTFKGGEVGLETAMNCIGNFAYLILAFTGAALLLFPRKYSFSFSFALLAFSSVLVNYRSGLLLTVCYILLAVTGLALRRNRKARPKILKFLKPDCSVLAFIAAIIAFILFLFSLRTFGREMHEVASETIRHSSGHFAGFKKGFFRGLFYYLRPVLTYAAVVMIALFSKVLPAGECPALSLNRFSVKRRSKLTIAGIIGFALNVLRLAFNCSRYYDWDIAEVYILGLIPFALYIIAFILMLTRKQGTALWISLLLIAVAEISLVRLNWYGWDGDLNGYAFDYTAGAGVAAAMLLLLASYIGYSGNRPVRSKLPGLTGTLALVIMVLTLFTALKALPVLFREIKDEDAWYKGAIVFNYLVAYKPLEYIGLGLIVFGSEITPIDHTVLRDICERLGRLTKIYKTFFQDVENKIQKAAKVIGSIFLTLTILAAIHTAIVLIVLLTGGEEFPILYYYVDWIVFFYSLGAMVASLLNAMLMWLLYAYGQITADIHRLRKNSDDMLADHALPAPAGAKAEAVPEPLPEAVPVSFPEPAPELPEL